MQTLLEAIDMATRQDEDFIRSQETWRKKRSGVTCLPRFKNISTIMKTMQRSYVRPPIIERPQPPMRPQSYIHCGHNHGDQPCQRHMGAVLNVARWIILYTIVPSIERCQKVQWDLRELLSFDHPCLGVPRGKGYCQLHQ